jgi:glycosyltransferase domain-containing protein
MKEINSEITLIVLVHNNQHYLKRILNYYSEYPAVSVLIMDSSVNKIEFPIHNHIKYVHVENNTTLTNKIYLALEKISTKYTTLLGVDDFITITGIKKCIDFLNIYSSYGCAIGNDIFFRINENKCIFFPVYSFQCHSIESDLPMNRVEKLFSNYRTIYCAVHRTSILLDIFKNAKDKVSYLYLNEFLMCIYPLLCGKFKHFEDIFTIREYDEGSEGFLSQKIYEIADSDPNAFQSFVEANTITAENKLNMDYNSTYNSLDKILLNFSNQLKTRASVNNITLEKKMGSLISLIPFLGKYIVKKRRYLHEKKINTAIYSNNPDKDSITEIQKVILSSL